MSIDTKVQSILTTLYPFDTQKTMSVSEAFAYCENIAKTHYENFTVGSFLMPLHLRPSIYTVYAFCRWADDLGDEIGDPNLSLKLLEAWDQELSLCKNGNPRHPVFIALKEIIKRHDLPLEPFHDLIHAFKMDQTTPRYSTFEDVLSYCRYSANPVGRIFLMLFNYRDEERFLLSDATCTALQLANFWQDIARDLEKGRIYIPLEDMKRFNYSENDLITHQTTPAFIELMKVEIHKTRDLFEKGLELIKKVQGKIQLDIELFSQGGLAILKMIEKNGYNVLSKRPSLSKSAKAQLALGSLFRYSLRNLFGRKTS